MLHHLSLGILFIFRLHIDGSDGFKQNQEVLSGFSDPAVVTARAVLILSEGLTRTGVADIIGRFVLRLAGSGETEIVMGVVLFPVEMGWVPIYIAPAVGAALKVFSKCLTMEESHRFIECKAVFLVTGMLPPARPRSKPVPLR